MHTLSWELIGLGIDAGLVYLFWRFYKNGVKHVEHIVNADKYEINEELLETLKNKKDGTIHYARVQGLTGTDLDPLVSNHKGQEKGVIQHCKIIEHRSKRTQGYWCDLTKTLRDTTDTVPFFLKCAAGGDARIHVEEPLQAQMLLDELKITYDHFEPSKANALQKGVDRLFGDISRGVQERESMLGLGVQLLGLGKVVLDNGKIKLVPPDSGHYIITKSSFNEVIRKLTSKARVYKVMAWLFGVAGVSFASYMIYKRLKVLMEKMRYKKLLQEMREVRRRQAHDLEEAEEGGANTCVICLSNPRETVVLDCGHIAMCLECSNALPDPRKCPICRADIRQIIPTYIA